MASNSGLLKYKKKRMLIRRNHVKTSYKIQWRIVTSNLMKYLKDLERKLTPRDAVENPILI